MVKVQWSGSTGKRPTGALASLMAFAAEAEATARRARAAVAEYRQSLEQPAPEHASIARAMAELLEDWAIELEASPSVARQTELSAAVTEVRAAVRRVRRGMHQIVGKSDTYCWRNFVLDVEDASKKYGNGEAYDEMTTGSLTNQVILAAAQREPERSPDLFGARKDIAALIATPLPSKGRPPRKRAPLAKGSASQSRDAALRDLCKTCGWEAVTLDGVRAARLGTPAKQLKAHRKTKR